MIRINLKSAPYWIELLPGLKVEVRPAGSAVILEAASARGDDESLGAFTRAMARVAITAWEGVADEDGKPVECTPEAIDALTDIWPVYKAFETLYARPAMLVSAEGND
jgi:hypothetical protein